jgi:hypothetical protein
MSYWKSQIVNLGVIKAGRSIKVIFEALPNMPKIKEIFPHCGCTSPNYSEKNRKLSITYSNAKIPPQVKGPQSIAKKIDITYETGETEILVIRAIKTR